MILNYSIENCTVSNIFPVFIPSIKYFLTKESLETMYFLIDCEEDWSVVICDETQLIVDREPEINEKVKFMWRAPARRTTEEFTGIVVAKSDCKQELEQKEKVYVEDMTASPKEYGKGFRKHIPKVLSSDSEVEPSTSFKERKDATKKSKSKAALKKLAEIQTAKFISSKLKVPQEPLRTSPRKSGVSPMKIKSEELCKGCKAKDQEINQLRTKLKKYKKQRDEGLELSKWLNQAKSLSDNLSRFPKSEMSDAPEVGHFLATEVACDSPLLEAANERVQLNVKENKEDYINSEHFKFNSNDFDVTKLTEDYDIYINKTVKQRIENMSRTHTQLARNTMEAVFSDEILKTCSLQGKSSKIKGNLQRAPMDPIGLRAVLKFALETAGKRKMKIEDEGYVKKQLSTRLSEIRRVNRE